MQNILLGPPGTGKTTTLLSLVDEQFQKGIEPNRIGFFSFTTKAANEAVERACTKFKLKPTDLPYFKTVHSLAFNWLGMSTQGVLNRKHYRQIFDLLGIEYTGKAIDEDDTNSGSGATLGDKILFIQNLSKAKMRPLKDEWEESDFNEEVLWDELERFQRTLDDYKAAHGLIDFNDMLEMFIEHPGHKPIFDAIFVDEAQDLSKLQWSALDKILPTCPTVYIAGDDDQAIFRWAGADVDHFISLEGNARVLNKSYRLRKNVHSICHGIISQVDNRRQKEFNPREDGGYVEYISDCSDIDMSSGTWLLLARNSYLLRAYEDICLSSGYSYSGRNSPLESDELKAIRAYENWRKGNMPSDSERKLILKFSRTLPDKPSIIWHEQLTKMDVKLREYFIAALRRGESLTKVPRIRISTIHGAKGAEADNVVVMSDISNRCYQALQLNPDDEHRVAYVAASRARENLYVIMPRTSNFYDYSML
ncbi:MAG TPA: ATP-dependent helicase [Vitreimonas sp.]|nr:ATP-dependent helicase [Vitreimonas sp.]